MDLRKMQPDRTPISRFPDLEKPGRELVNQLMRTLILTTQGDLLTRGSTYLKRLPIGTAGQVLTVDSGGDDPEWSSTSVQNTSARILAYLGL
jgi:hypothetical protein